MVASTKSVVVQELIQFGVKQAKYLPFAYDESIHYPPKTKDKLTKEKFSANIAFIGNGDRERLPYFEAVQEIDGVTFNVYGVNWNKVPLRGILKQIKVNQPVFNDDLSFATYYSDICLGIVRKGNKDQSTARSFEIAACGGCGIYEDTKEHRDIFRSYPDYGFFISPQDLADKCHWLLEHPVEREAMRQLGIQLVVNESNTYTARLKTILEWALL